MTTVFSGHRIDDPDRPAPRFPDARISAVRASISAQVAPGDLCLSSLANGADILFAEACRAAGAYHHIVLPSGPDRFIETSVRTAADGDWVERFRAIWDATPAGRRHVLGTTDDYDACNRALIAMALEAPPPRRLLAVWDGIDTGRPGGTSSMVALARQAGFELEILDPRPRPKLMLALDGGGLLGLISLGILRRIEAQLREIRGDPDLRLGQVFDYIGGTSTGAIIAAGLALGKSVDDLRDLYLDRGREIFPHWIWNLPRNILSRGSHLYSAAGVSRVLREEMGAGTILEMQRDGRLSRKRHLLIIARNKTTNSCWPLSTNPDAHYNCETRPDCNLRIPLWQVVRASTAAPFFFPPERIHLNPSDPSRLFHFEDGGLTAHNNPALKLFQLATMPEYGLKWPRGVHNLVIISVGTGRNERRRTDISDWGDGLLKLAQRTPGSLMSGISAENDLTCRLIGRCVHGHRLDSEVGELVPGGPLSKDTGEAFLYARYDADLSDTGLKAVGLSATDRDLRMDRVASLPLFDQIGAAYANEVDLRKHFDGAAMFA